MDDDEISVEANKKEGEYGGTDAYYENSLLDYELLSTKKGF
jgi:hypothetical protein